MLDDLLERFDGERITASVWGDRDPAAVRMPVSPVRPFLAKKHEPVTSQGSHQLSGGEGAEPAVVNRHDL
jgi:hypothetical protein